MARTIDIDVPASAVPVREEADRNIEQLITDMLEVIDLRDLDSASDANLEQLAVLTTRLQSRIARARGPHFIDAAYTRWGRRLLERARARRVMN